VNAVPTCIHSSTGRVLSLSTSAVLSSAIFSIEYLAPKNYQITWHLIRYW